MNGGLFEGMKKCYKGPHAAGIHGIIFAVVALLCGITNYGYSKLPEEIVGNIAVSEKMFYKYLFFEQPLLGILMLIISFLLGLYLVNVTHNALRIFEQRRENEEMADKLPLLPDFKFAHLGKILLGMLAISLVWGCYFSVLIFISSVIKLPVLISIFSLLFAIIMPVIFTRFADNYEIRPQLNPLIAFNILKKLFLQVLWLYIRYLGIAILIGIATVILTILFAILLGASWKLFITYAIVTIIFYVIMIYTFAFYYSVAYLYDKKFKEEN